MALLRIGNTSDLLTGLSRISANTLLGELHCTRYAAVHQSRINGLHLTSIRRYPDPPILPLPTNVSSIFANETGRFTPERARDIAAPVLIYGKHNGGSFSCEQTVDRSNIPLIREDTHVDSYDCFGAVSLNGTMQSNVPKPFCSSGKSSYLNMPGGQWARDGKYIAEDMQNSHYRSVHVQRYNLEKIDPGMVKAGTLLHTKYQPRYIFGMAYSTEAPNQPKAAPILLTKKEKLKQALKTYGATVVVFHIALSLVSLGTLYICILRGVDLSSIVRFVTKLEKPEDLVTAGNATTFVLAYSVHKLLAPLRIAITLAVTPPLAKYLRKIGVIKFRRPDVTK